MEVRITPFCSCFSCLLSVQDLAAAMRQRVTQATTVHDNDVYSAERAVSCKVPWLVVGPDGVCSVAHKLTVETVENCSGDSKHGTQVLVRPATQHCSGKCPQAQSCCNTEM